MRERWRRWLRIGRPDVRADVEDELAFHLEMRVQELMARGASEADARREASNRFGAVEPVRTELVRHDARRDRRLRGRTWLADFRQDLGYAGRTLRRNPGFAAMAVACVGLGIGVTTTIFSAARGILLRPLPYPEADKLVAVYARHVERGIAGGNVAWPDYLSWREQAKSFDQIGLWTWSTITLAGDGPAERLDGAEVTANLFPLLGVKPVVGRGFDRADEVEGRDRVLLLSHEVWQRRYGGDGALIGRSIRVDGVPYEVIGVMPPGFAFPSRGRAWVPYVPDALARNRGNRFLAGAIGRLAPQVTEAQAQAELDAISARLEQEFVVQNRGWSAEVMSLREDLVGSMRRPLEVFGVAVGFVLLIACANVAGLLLARGAARGRELAVRGSLGAPRGRLVRQLVAESLVIALAGGAVGAVLATQGVALYRAAFPNEVPFYIRLQVDLAALGFAVALSVGVGLLFGVLPALGATRLELARAMNAGGRGAVGSGDGRARSALIVAEVALAMVLMIGASLLLRSYAALTSTEFGFEPRGALTARIALPFEQYRAREARATFYRALLDRLAALPGVERVGSAQGIPFSGWDVQSFTAIEGRPPRPPGDELDVHFQSITPGYFDAIGTAIVSGRGFTEADRDSTAVNVVINQTMARMEFSGQDPIGQRVQVGGMGPAYATIVGVVGDFRHYRLPRPMGPAVYFPYFATPYLAQTLVLRTSLSDPERLIRSLEEAVRALDPDVPLYEVQTLEQATGRSLWQPRLQGQVVGLFAVLALILAAVGLYGVIAYSVTQRTRELGVRMTLGATAGGIARLVLGQAARLALAGVGLGVAGALGLTRFLTSLLHGVAPTDLATFLTVPLILVAVALAAGWVPARRAARVDPLVAIRAE